MNNNDLVDIQSLAQRLQKQGRSIFSNWRFTAHEICPSRHKEIEMVYSCYQDLHEDELKLFRYESFIEAMMNELTTEEDKRKLLLAEAQLEKKF